MKFGAHLSTARGFDHAVRRGAEIGCDTIQIFTKSPSQWRAPGLSPEALASYQNARAETGIAPIFAHSAYLINLAAPDRAVLERSRAAFVEELQRAEALGVECLVIHPGSHRGEGEAGGLQRLGESLQILLDQTAGLQVKIALETTAGQGSSLGWRFEQLGDALARVHGDERVVVCVDSCHIFAAGYELRAPDGYARTMQELDRHVGLERVAVLHANDSARPLGSRIDRHAHIGEGAIGEAGFRNLLTDPRWREVAVILETPESETMHAVNLQRLRRLAGGRRVSARKSRRSITRAPAD